MRGVKLSEGDLEALPFYKRVQEQSEDPLPVREDFFTDLSCATISLSWPDGHDTGGGQQNYQQQQNNTYDSEQAYVTALAKHHWVLIRMLVNYQRMHHRHLVQRWFEIIDGILQKAKIRAKEVAERVRLEQGFDVDVSPLMKVQAKDGSRLPASAFAIGATTDF